MPGKANARSMVLAVLLACGFFQCQTRTQTEGNTPAAKTVAWRTDLATAQASAMSTRKPVMTVFTAAWCPWCKRMQDSTFIDPRVVEKTAAFVTVKIDVDSQKTVADRFNANARKHGGMGIPNTLFLSPNGVILKHAVGYYDAKTFLVLMDSVLTALPR